MKRSFNVVELDRIVKFLDGLNKLAAVHKVGFYSDGDYVRLAMEGYDLPVVLDTDDDGQFLLVEFAK